MSDRLSLVVNQQIRPHLNEHGGDMEIVNINEGIVRVRLSGSCSNCPGVKLTFEHIIRKTLLKEIPELRDVVLIEQMNNELLAFARSILNKRIEG